MLKLGIGNAFGFLLYFSISTLILHTACAGIVQHDCETGNIQ